MMKLLFATKNSNKIKEMSLLIGARYHIVSARQAGILDEAVEDGATFEQNAIKKAQHIFKKTNEICIAEDSGLAVDCLGGAPGIFTARYASIGVNAASDIDNMHKLLSELRGVPFGSRGAHFVCVIALIMSNGHCQTFTGQCHGKILFDAVGQGGFGYDPIFYVEKFGCSMAQVGIGVKNIISHRAVAARKLKEVLDTRNEETV